MTSYNPTNMAQVHMALARIAADVAVEGLPLPELPGARTVGDLRTLRDWPQGLRLVVEPRDFVVRVERINHTDVSLLLVTPYGLPSWSPSFLCGF